MADARFNGKGYYATENDKHENEFQFNKKSGRVNPKVAPDGYRFTPYPLPDDSPIREFLDPRFVMPHQFSSTWSDAFFLLEPVKKSKEMHQSIKTDAQKDERHASRTVVFTDLDSTDEDGNTVPFDIPASNSTEKEALRNVIRDEVKKELRKLDAKNKAFNKAHPSAERRITVHETIYQKCYIWHDTVTETSDDLGMAKTTVSEAIKHINKIARPFYKG